jgi:hypothetical protein
MRFKMGERLAAFFRGEITSKDFAAEMAQYYDSPEWRRLQAERAAQALKEWRDGRERLLELIKEAQEKGFDILTRRMPMNEGHDSLVVSVEGTLLGFPSFFHREIIEEMFTDLLKGAQERRDANGGRPVHNRAEEEARLDEMAGHMEKARRLR